MEKTAVSAILSSSCTECVKELEVVVPDYYPELLKVVRTEAIPMIKDTKHSGQKLEVIGNIKFVVLYIGSDGKVLCSYQTMADFTGALVSCYRDGYITTLPRTELPAAHNQCDPYRIGYSDFYTPDRRIGSKHDHQ